MAITPDGDECVYNRWLMMRKLILMIVHKLTTYDNTCTSIKLELLILEMLVPICALELLVFASTELIYRLIYSIYRYIKQYMNQHHEAEDTPAHLA